jgi:hypothetical protein
MTTGGSSGQPQGGQPSEAELRAAFEEQMKRITVQDVLVQTAVTMIDLAGRRLGLAGPEGEQEEPDLEQSRLAIEATRALLPLLPEEVGAPVRDALSQLQLAFAREAQGVDEPPEGEPPSDEPADEPADEAARAEARSRIWTPPGA